MRILSSLSVVVGIVGIASGLKQSRQPKILSSRPADSIVFNIRGGAGPFDPTTLAKGVTVFAGAQSLTNILCPESIVKSSGFTPSNENVCTTKGIGFAQLSVAVAASQVLFEGKSVDTALAYGLVPFVIGNVAAMINGDMEHLGSTNSVLLFWSSIEGTLIYGLSNGFCWAETGVKALATLILAVSVVLALDPARGIAMTGSLKAPPPLHLAEIVRIYGSALIGAAVLLFALASGVDATKAIGYAWTPSIIRSI